MPEPDSPGFLTECRVLRNVRIPMRDGVWLEATVFLPPAEGAFPVVLVRTAYNRAGMYDPFYPRRGMALVIQDCRGRYGSEGRFHAFKQETHDGYDTLEWIGRQPWCNGHIGMFGDSYLAATQFAAARAGSPHLRALAPRFMAGDCWKRGYYCDGVFSLALTWSWLCFEVAGRTSDAATLPRLDVDGILRSQPLERLDAASGAGRIPRYREYVRHGHYDAHWKSLSIRKHYRRFRMPTLLIGGWYDYYPQETIVNYLGMRRQAASAGLRDAHRLLIGPWSHGVNPLSTLGELDFGPEALRENEATKRWLDGILHGRTPSEIQAAPVRIFVMGRNVWRDETEWPPARTRITAFYLRAGGRLSTAAPTGREPPDTYTYDPGDPVPTHGGNHSIGPYNPGLFEMCRPGPFDQRAVERRADVRIYTSAVLRRDLDVTGHIVLRLYAATSAPDTDFVARLTDVYPDGRSINITEGVIRARFRQGVMEPPAPVNPGKIYRYEIDLQVTSNVFLRGHRIRLQLTSSNFPLWDRNPNTGDAPGTDTGMRTARQTLWHSSAHPSCLLLPLVGAD